MSTQIMNSATQQATGMDHVGSAMGSINQIATQNMSATAQTEHAVRELNGIGLKAHRAAEGFGTSWSVRHGQVCPHPASA